MSAVYVCCARSCCVCAAALVLASLGATVVLAGRSAGRLHDAAEFIVKSVPDAKLDIMVVDLADLASVKKCAQDFLAKYTRLDILINKFVCGYAFRLHYHYIALFHVCLSALALRQIAFSYRKMD